MQGALVCGQCGQPVDAAPSPATASTPTPAFAPLPATTPPPAATEPVLDFVPTVRRRTGFMGLKAESFTVMVTLARLVFVPISSEEMKQAVAEALDQAKQAGKGFFGQWGERLAWLGIIHARLAAMSVDAVLASCTGSFAIPLPTVRKVKVDVDVGDEDSGTTTRLIIETNAGKHSFELTAGGSEEVKALLKQALGDIVK